MADPRVEKLWERFLWRIQSNYVPMWELEQIRHAVQRWEDWCAEWSRRAEAHVARGDEALTAGHRHTAGEAFVQAALYYHWAGFLYPHLPDQFRSALEGMGRALAKAAPLVDPPMEMLEIPFEGTTLPAYLRKPAGIERPPLAVLVPGGDSTKEELYNLGQYIADRGTAILVMDGPGHGAVSFHLKIRPDFEVPIRAVIDHVFHRPDLDTGRLAVGGISYGGLFACRAAATDERVKAVFSMSSWYTTAGRWPSLDPVSQTGLKQYMGENAEEVQNRITLAGLAARVRVPLLQVYGGRDPASPPEQARRVESEVKGPTTTVVFQDGVHVCNNLWYLARPLVGDWLAETLGAVEPAP